MIEKKYIECTCDTEVLQLRYIKGALDHELQLAIYEWGVKNKKTSFKEKIRMIIKILKTGTFYSDQMILSPDKTIELRDFLSDCIKKAGVK